jgi:hypothetical protein
VDATLHTDVIAVHHQEQPTTTGGDALRHSRHDHGQLSRARCSKDGAAREGKAGRERVRESLDYHGYIYPVWI